MHCKLVIIGLQAVCMCQQAEPLATKIELETIVLYLTLRHWSWGNVTEIEVFRGVVGFSKYNHITNLWTCFLHKAFFHEVSG